MRSWCSCLFLNAVVFVADYYNVTFSHLYFIHLFILTFVGSIRRSKIYDKFSEMQIKMENGNFYGDFKEEYKLRNDYKYPGRANFLKVFIILNPQSTLHVFAQKYTITITKFFFMEDQENVTGSSWLATLIVEKTIVSYFKNW